MKKIFVFVITVFIAVQMAAQIEWVGDFGQSSRTSGFYKTSNNQFVITRDTEDDAGFSVVDSSGNLVFNYSDPYLFNPGQSGGEGRLNEIYDFVELADSSYLFILLEAEYDCQVTGYSDAFFKLLRFDKNWDEINLNVSTVSFLNASFELFLAPLPDGTFLLLSDFQGELQKRDALGELIWSEDLPYYFEAIKDFSIVSGDTTAIITYDSTFMLDGQGAIIRSYPYIFDRIKPTPDGNFYGTEDDSLFLLTPTFEVLDRLGFSEVIRDFASSDSTLVVLTSTNSIYVFDHSFNSLSSVQVDGHYPLAYIESLPLSIIAAGTTLYGEDSWRFSRNPFLKEIPYSGGIPDNSEDIGVTDIEMIGTPTVSVPAYGEYQLTYDSLKITVQNFGNNTIDSLKLNSFFQSISLNLGLCFFYQFPHKKFDNLSLLPGESQDLYWESFEIAFREIPEEDFEICIWSSLPNQKIDRDSGNDLFCADFLVSNKEVTPMSFSGSVFPNPVNDYLNIKLEALLKGCRDCLIRIIDISGRERYANKVDTNRQVLEVPVWDWEAGLYFVQYVSERGPIGTLRFVVIK
ncbi:MAG: T9SS type A sorting domain-containing protein [Bacteroidota bacterium]